MSGHGNLYASGLFPAFDIPAQTAQLSFVAALSIADVITAYASDAAVTLKWPNDVLVGGAKISGVLLETGVFDSEPYVVVGIGLNLVNHPDTALYPATHLLAHMPEDSLSGPEPTFTGAEAVLAVLAARFEHWRAVHAEQGFAPIRTAWTARAHGLGQWGQVDGTAAKLIGLGDNGELQVERESGTIETIFAGDVFFGAEEG